ncbi:MAG: HIT domain-containing protein [Firmicutes bacterium]|nr:HIT domain-containing protein [Bacillota bacterium]
MQCPFCYPESDPEQSIVLANELCYFLQRPQPVLVGSGVIVPKKHRETVFDLTKDEWEATFRLLQEAKALLDSQYQPDGYNIGWNCGPVGGQEIFHAHLHVIPRFADEPLAGKGIRYWLKQPCNQRL